MIATTLSAQKEPPHVASVIEVVRSWSESYVRNSYLSAIKRALNGEPQWMGSEGFNIFGRELHGRYLLPETWVPTRLSDHDEALLEAMILTLQRDRRLKVIFRNSLKEKDYFATIDGVRCRITGDLIEKNPGHGEDIKTTSCKSQREFELAAHRYGYFRQGDFYSTVAHLKTFTFSGITKSLSPEIFVVNVQDYPLWVKEGREEWKYLLGIHKRYKR